VLEPVGALSRGVGGAIYTDSWGMYAGQLEVQLAFGALLRTAVGGKVSQHAKLIKYSKRKDNNLIMIK
jgi:hypothetical protein